MATASPTCWWEIRRGRLSSRRNENRGSPRACWEPPAWKCPAGVFLRASKTVYSGCVALITWLEKDSLYMICGARYDEPAGCSSEGLSFGQDGGDDDQRKLRQARVVRADSIGGGGVPGAR